MYDLIDGYELQYYTIFKANKVYKTKKTNCTIANRLIMLATLSPAR